MLLKLDIDPANVNLIGFASNVTGDTFVLTANNSGDSLAHQVSVRNDTANDHSGKTLTLVGTDANGNPQTEVITGPGVSATVESTKYFLTLISVTPSATIGADTFDIGWVDEVASRTVALNHSEHVPSNFWLDITGTINVDVQFTQTDVLSVPTYPDQEAHLWVAGDAALTAETADSTAVIVVPAGFAGFRVKVNSYTDTAELQLHVTQAQRRP